MIFLLSGLSLRGEVVEEFEVDEEEEYQRGLDAPRHAVPINGEDPAALAARVAMARRERKPVTEGFVGLHFHGLDSFLGVVLTWRIVDRRIVPG